MFLKKKIQGLEKVKFWLVVLMILLSASLGVYVGEIWQKGITVPESIFDSLRTLAIDVWEYYSDIYVSNPAFFWIIMIAAVLGFCVIEYLYQKFRPKKRKTLKVSSISDLVMLQLLLYIGAFVVFFLSVNGDFVNSQLLRFLKIEFGAFTLITAFEIIMVLRDVYVKHNSEDYVYFEKNKKKVLAVTTAVAMAVVGLPLWLPGFWGFEFVLLKNANELLGYYTALLSLTFISISVMGVLSDRSVVIYWDNIAEGKLIKPVFGSFAAFTYYSIGAAVGAGVSVVTRNAVAFFAFCIINVFTLILLTFNMVDIYYDREGKKEQRVKQLYDDLCDYIWVCKERTLTDSDLEKHYKKLDQGTGKETDNNYTDAEVRNMHIGHRNYEEKMMLLYQHINIAKQECDIAYLKEVYELFSNNLKCFESPLGKRVAELLYTESNRETWPLILRNIRDFLDSIEKRQIKDEDTFTEEFSKNHYRWNEDFLLWQSLADAEYLKEWLRDADKNSFKKREIEEFMQLVVRRWVILYNDMAAHINYCGKIKPINVLKKDAEKFSDIIAEIKFVCREIRTVFSEKTAAEPEEIKYDYLNVLPYQDGICVVTKHKEKPNIEKTQELLGACVSDMSEGLPLISSLIQLILVVSENLQGESKQKFENCLKEFSLPSEIMQYIKNQNM